MKAAPGFYFPDLDFVYGQCVLINNFDLCNFQSSKNAKCTIPTQAHHTKAQNVQQKNATKKIDEINMVGLSGSLLVRECAKFLLGILIYMYVYINKN